MAIWLVEGRLGSGKGKYAVKKIREYLSQDRRVVTNMDIHLEHLARPMSKRTVIRIPDYPTVDDLELIGHGNPGSYDEEKNGLIVVDELSKFMNARDFQNKGRKGVIDWLVESRKKGWDVMFSCQAGLQIDKQIREALCEYVVTCYRLDRVRIPFGVGWLIENLSLGFCSGRMPRIHMANVRLAAGGRGGMVLDREMYRGDDLQAAYDTRQQFREWTDPAWYERDPRCGPHSLLSAWHLRGRHEGPRLGLRGRMAALLRPQQRACAPIARPRSALDALPAEIRWELAKARAEGRPLPRPRDLLAVWPGSTLQN